MKIRFTLHLGISLVLVGILQQAYPLRSLAEPSAPEKAAVAYLMGIQGAVSILSEEVHCVTNTTCEPVMDGQVIRVADDSSAVLLFAESAYKLDQPGDYIVGRTELVKKAQDDGAGVPVKSLNTRGNPLLTLDSPNLVLPPADLFASVKPPVMRTVSAITVLSPAGATMSRMPKIVLTGHKNQRVRLRLYRIVDGVGLVNGKVFELHGYECDWSATGWPPLEPSSSYYIVVSQGNVIFSDPELRIDALSSGAFGPVSEMIDSVESMLPAGMVRDFSVASILINSQPPLFAEARLLAVELLRKDPGNRTYLHLLRRCYTGLRMPDGYRAVDNELSKGR